MNPRLSQSLEEAIQETFENMAFLETVPADQPPLELPSETMGARLAVTAPAPGMVHLVLSTALLRNVGEILYAEPAEELTDEALQDLLFELVNTVVGMLLNRFLPEDQTYSLGLPEKAPSLPAPRPEVTAYFLVDNTPVLAAVDGRILSWGAG